MANDPVMLSTANPAERNARAVLGAGRALSRAQRERVAADAVTDDAERALAGNSLASLARPPEAGGPFASHAADWARRPETTKAVR
jgi:ABC-type sugar transport system substrate-binding protein